MSQKKTSQQRPDRNTERDERGGKKRKRPKKRPYASQMVWLILGCLIIGLFGGFCAGKYLIYPKLHAKYGGEYAVGSDAEKKAQELQNINQQINQDSDDNSESNLENDGYTETTTEAASTEGENTEPQNADDLYQIFNEN